DALRLADLAFAQLFEDADHDELHQVIGGVAVAQMAQAVAAHARGHAAIELRLGAAVAAWCRSRDAPGHARLLASIPLADLFHPGKHRRASRTRNPDVTLPTARDTSCPEPLSEELPHGHP